MPAEDGRLKNKKFTKNGGKINEKEIIALYIILPVWSQVVVLQHVLPSSSASPASVWSGGGAVSSPILLLTLLVAKCIFFHSREQY